MEDYHMALSNNFYNDIFEKEKYWMELINHGLLNIYYLNGEGGIKEFYLNKMEKLEYEYESTGNQIIKNFLELINNIINQIDYLTNEYRQGELIDMKSLSTLFLHNQINNNVNDNKNSHDIEKIRLQKQVLQSLRKVYNNPESISDDYDYLYEEPDYKGKVA